MVVGGQRGSGESREEATATVQVISDMAWSGGAVGVQWRRGEGVRGKPIGRGFEGKD